MNEKWKKTAYHLYLTGSYGWKALQNEVNKLEKLNLGYDKIRDYIRNTDEYKKAHEHTHKVQDEVTKEYKEVTEILPNGNYRSDQLILMSIAQGKDKDFLLTAHGYSPKDFDLVSSKSKRWNVYSKQDGVQQLYSSCITVKPIVGIKQEDVLKHFIEQASKYSPVQPRKTKQSSNNALVVNVTDLHVGQLSWYKESGKNYDYKLATNNYETIINDAITKSPYKEYDIIYYILGNDLFNSDNMEGSTTKGTKQTNDVRPQKMFDKAEDLTIWGIDALRLAFPTTKIEILLVPGNHDTLTAFYLSKVVRAWFRNDPTVKVDTLPMLHKGIVYGNTAILFTHGQRELKNLDWVYTEFRHLIGSTKTTEIHAGHMHRVRVEEKNGAIIRQNPSASVLDNWSYGEGYNSISQAISRVYSKQGLEYEIYSRT